MPGDAGYRAGERAYEEVASARTFHGAGISGIAATRDADEKSSAGRRRSGSDSGEHAQRRHGRSTRTTRRADARGRRRAARNTTARRERARHAARLERVVTGLNQFEVSPSATDPGATTRPFASAYTRSASAVRRAGWPCAASRIASVSGCCAGSRRATRCASASTSDGRTSAGAGAKNGGDGGGGSTNEDARPESHIVRASLSAG